MFKEHKKSHFSKQSVPKIFIMEKDENGNSDRDILIPLIKT